MPQHTRGGAARRKRDSQRRRRQQSAGIRERSRSDPKTRFQPDQFRLLIDENLTPNLANLARSRGFHAVHVNDINLRTLADYAVDNGVVLVTNNMADFRRLYARRKLHPGLIFLQCGTEEIFTDINQAALLDAVLDDMLQNDLVQEAIRITLIEDASDELGWELARYLLPED